MITYPIRFLLLLIQSVFLALGQIWANKMRSFLTTLGIILGVASVTTVIAALSGLQKTVLDDFEAMGANKMFIESRWPEEGRFKRASYRMIRFYPSHFDGALEKCPSLESLTLICDYRGTVRFGETTVESVRVTGIEPDWHEIEDRFVESGRIITQIDNDQYRQVCLIDLELRDKLNLNRDPVGQTIYVGVRPYTVVGVVEKRANSSMFGMARGSHEIFVPFATAWNLEQPWIHAIAASKSTEVSKEAAAELRHVLRTNRNLRYDDPDTFRIHVIDQYIEQFEEMARMITLVAAGIVGISLVVGGVGIMNIMLVSVSERTREIGLRKAVGARPAAVLLQFLIEAIVLCVLGGGLGLFGGQCLTWLMKTVPDMKLEEAYIPLEAVYLAIGFSSAIGLIFG
ncbi:MAG: ABC transporter permease, partial [Planctomycetota bacterium]